MKRLILILVMSMVTACASGCGNLNVKPVAQGEIRIAPSALTPLRAEADARAALTKGDRHLTGVYGYTTMAPGALNDEFPTDWPHGLLVIEGTSDGGNYAFNTRAVAYASAYNRVILAEATAPKTRPRPRSPG